jgi:hypothetical protein
MSRPIYYHMRTINAINRDEHNYKRPENYGFTDAEFIEMDNRSRTRIINKLKYLGFYTEADRLRDIARIKQK